MAIDRQHWKMILAANVKGRALSAGYPDLLLSLPDFKPRPDSAEIAAHHGVKYPIADSKEVFASIGLELDVIDRAVIRGDERVVDLNADGDYCVPDNSIPYPERDQIKRNSQWLGEYHLVIDPGTSEHCFNVAQALVNLADAVKVGGVIVQALPMAMFNHGYWNVNPVALIDFYQANGFEIEDLVIRHSQGIFTPTKEQRSMRMQGVPENSVTLITARRLEQREFVWPQQGSM